MSQLHRGDTIIEVMVAFAVFAMVAVGALTVMNRGTASAQDTLETTLVRQQIDNQAEMLRYLHQAYLANPTDMTAGSLSSKFWAIVTQAKEAESVGGIKQATEYGAPCIQTIPGDPAYRFVLNTDLNAANVGTRLASANILPASAADAPAYARVDNGKAYGLWIEPVISNQSVASGTNQFIDFHIRACWNSASSVPQRTLGTIVRLYVPENVDTASRGSVSLVALSLARNYSATGVHL